MMLKQKISRFFRQLVGKKQRDLWQKFNSIPKSLVRVCMFITQNGNHVEKRFLSSELVREGIVTASSCSVILHRGIEKDILKEKDGYVSVVEPTRFVVKAVRGSLLDNWKGLIIVTLGMTIISSSAPSVSAFFAVLSLVGVIGWFIEDFLTIEKF